MDKHTAAVYERYIIMLTKNFKTTFSLIAYTSLFNVVCFTLNVISFSYAQIGYISSFITLGIQLLLLPIYFTFIGFISKKLEFKQFMPFIIFSVISGVLLILFSLIFFDLLPLYIQGLVCSLLMISQLIEVFLPIESTVLSVGITIVIFLLEMFFKVLFIRFGNKIKWAQSSD